MRKHKKSSHARYRGLVGQRRLSGITERKCVEEALHEREEKFRALIQHSSDAIVMMNAQGRVSFESPAAESLIGYRSEERLGRSALDWIHPDDLKCVRQVFERVVSEPGLTQSVECRLRHEDGTWRWVEAVGSNLLDVPAVHAIVVNNRDITDRKRAEDSLRQSEEVFRTLIDHGREAILLLDAHGVILFGSPAAERLLGYSPQEFLGRSGFDDIHPDDRERMRGFLARLVSEPGSSQRQEYRLRHKDGTWVWVDSVVTNSLHVPAVHGIVVNSRHITDRKQAEEALRERDRQMTALVTSLDDIVFEVDEEGTYRQIWTSNESLLAMPKSHLLGRNLADVWGEEKGGAMRSALQGVLANGHPKVLEFPVATPQGALWVMARVNPIIVPGQAPRQAVVLVRDITERRRADEALRMSEAQLSNAVKIAHLGPWEYDVAGDLFTFNDHFFAVYRTTAGQVGGYTMRWADYAQRFIHPEDATMVDVEIRKAREAADPHFSRHLEHRIIRGDGEVGYVAVRFFVVKDDQGRTIKTYGVNQDITDYKRAEEEVKKSREWLNAIFDASRDGIVVEDDGMIVYANKALADLLGFSSSQELMGRKFSLGLSPHDDERIMELGRKRLKGEPAPVLDEFKGRRKDGTTLDLEASVSTAAIASRRYLISLIRDVSDRKKLELRLSQAQKMQSLGTLAGGVAHDFNNTLGIILGYASSVDWDIADPVQLKESMDAIIKATHRGAGLVRQLLTFARQADIRLEAVKIGDSIREVIMLLQATFPKTVVVSAHIEPDLPGIMADATQMHQVLLNLCVNARDAMPKGGQVTISARRVSGQTVRPRFPKADHSHYIHIEVTDTGTGIDEQTRGRIFEPFFTTKGVGKGTGLGLATVYGIIENHEGFVDVESEIGRGTAFHIYLPVQAPPLEKHQVASEDRDEAARGKESILVVEDEHALRELVKRLLLAKGYRVLEAKDGKEALDVFTRKQRDIDLVVTDIGLPRISGDDLVRTLKSIDRHKKVIVASGYIDPLVKSELFKLGVTEFVQKPYIPRELLKKVRETLDSEIDGEQIRRSAD